MSKKRDYIFVWEAKHSMEKGYTTFELNHKLKADQINIYLEEIRDYYDLLCKPILLNIIEVEG